MGQVVDSKPSLKACFDSEKQLEIGPRSDLARKFLKILLLHDTYLRLIGALWGSF